MIHVPVKSVRAAAIPAATSSERKAIAPFIERKAFKRALVLTR